MSPRAAQANARVPPHSGHGSPVNARKGHGGISDVPSRETTAPTANGTQPMASRRVPSRRASVTEA